MSVRFDYSAARVDRTSAPPKLHRQRFARSSYRRGTPLTGTCNSIFKDEHPSLLSIAPASRPERAPHFTTLGSLRRPAFGPGWRFLPTRHRAPLTSDVPLPLPRRRVNVAGFDASSEHLRSLLVAATPTTGFHRRRLGPLGPAVGRNQRRARTDTTTLNDFCNRQTARAHWQTIATRRAAAFHDNTLHLAVLRRRALSAPAVQVESQPRARHGRRLSSWKRTSLSRASASTP